MPLLVVVFCGLFALNTNAQTFRGAINGTVTDPSDAAVVGAQVKALEIRNGIEHTMASHRKAIRISGLALSVSTN